MSEVTEMEFLETLEVDTENQTILRVYKIWQWEPMTEAEKEWYADNG